MLKERAFKQIDVFSREPLRGNPVAVVLDASGLSDDDMQGIAAWTNLSETTFVFPPSVKGAAYAVRIFTPRSELPFAGHPTLGTAHAVLEAGLAATESGHFRQECQVGLVDLYARGDWQREGLALALPTHQVAPIEGKEDAAVRALGGSVRTIGEPLRIDVGPVWLIIELASAAALETLQPNGPEIERLSNELGLTGYTVFAKTAGADGDIVVRTFAPAVGIAEDPVCGSGNGAIAAYRLSQGDLKDGDSYLARQGQQLGRSGEVSIAIEQGRILLGGVSVTTINGTLQTAEKA